MRAIRLNLTESEREDAEHALREAASSGWAQGEDEQGRCEVMANDCSSGVLDLEPLDCELLVGSLAEGLSGTLFEHDDENTESEQRAEVVTLITKIVRTLATERMMVR